LLLAPLAFVAHDKLLARWQERRTEPEYDVIDAPATPVVIAGYGRYGQIVSRVLRMCDIAFTALEVNYQQVDFVRRFGNKIYFGDATRLYLLQAAKTGDAKLFVLAIDDVEASVKCATLVRRHFPQVAYSPARVTGFITSACAIWASTRSIGKLFRQALKSRIPRYCGSGSASRTRSAR